MINVKYERQLDETIFKVDGHANSAPYGQDIVCASVSTALIMTANLLQRINNGYNILKLVCEEGKFLMKVKNDDEVVSSICQNLADTLYELSIDYPQYIRYNG